MRSFVLVETKGRTGTCRFAHMFQPDLLRQTRAPALLPSLPPAQHTTLLLSPCSPLLPHICCSTSLPAPPSGSPPRNHLQHEVAKEHRDSHEAALLLMQNILCSTPGGLGGRDMAGPERGLVDEQSQDAKAPHTSVVRNHWNPLSHLCWLHKLQCPLTAVEGLSKTRSLLEQQLFAAATASHAELPHFDSAPII